MPRVAVLLAILVMAALVVPVSAQDASPVPTPTVQRDIDVAYGSVDGTPLLLDVYRPAPREEPRPAVVLIHGGGLMSGGRYFMADHAEALAEAGYVSFNIAYRLATYDGVNQWPAQLDDVQRAVRFVRAHAADYGVDPERVCSYGHSSGGHLAALLGVRDTRVDDDPALAGISSRADCAVALAPETDMTIPYTAAFYPSVFGGTLEEIPDVYRDASPLTYVDEETVPFLFVHGIPDDAVPVEHSRLMTAALQGLGIEVMLVELAGASHFTTNLWPEVAPFALAFLARQLHPER